MQNGKTIKIRKNVDFNVDIFKNKNKTKFLLYKMIESDIVKILAA